jgi:hypothetical protein
MQTLTKKQKATGKGKNPIGLYKNDNNWPMHTLHRLRIKPSTL